MNPERIVHGMGRTDTVTVNHEGKTKESYKAWKRMLERVYGNNKDISPNYKGCSVDPEWLSYKTFEEWYKCNHFIDSQLDKDILVPGNKVYGPLFCRYVPKEVNLLLNQSPKTRSKYGQGVSKTESGKFSVNMSVNGRNTHLGTYESATEAASFYKDARESYVKLVAEFYLSIGLIENDIYEALNKWRVSDD